MTAERRKEVTEAFRLYARNQQYGTGSDPIDPEALRTITAVAQTLSVLRCIGKPDIADAVERIYFVDPREPLHRNDIERRVTRYSMNCYISRSTVYNWLDRAREIYWAIRNY